MIVRKLLTSLLPYEESGKHQITHHADQAVWCFLACSSASQVNRPPELQFAPKLIS
jgi:hypothetical protein